MTRSTFLLPGDEQGTIAPQYRYNRETGERRNIGPKCRHRTGSEYESGGGGCISTVDDYIKFLEAGGDAHR